MHYCACVMLGSLAQADLRPPSGCQHVSPIQSLTQVFAIEKLGVEHARESVRDHKTGPGP